jgi:ribosomal protein S27AE
MLIVVVLFATVLLRAAIVTTFVYLMLPAKRECPRCGAQLALIQHTVLRRLLPVVQHRWCLDCGWSGVVRHVQSRVIRRAARNTCKGNN